MHLTTIQHGAYLMVLMAMWSSPSGRLNFDVGTLCRITGLTPEQWQENQLVLMRFFTVEGKEFYQKRLTYERLRNEQLRQKRSEVGRLGGRPRKPIGLENQKVKQNESNHNHNHSTKPPIVPQGGQGALALKDGNGQYSADFLEFWKLYPKKVGKGAAFKAWRHAARPETSVLLDALRTHIVSHDWTKDGGQFIPHPQTWLNARRWEDEPASLSMASSEQKPKTLREKDSDLQDKQVQALNQWIDHEILPNL